MDIDNPEPSSDDGVKHRNFKLDKFELESSLREIVSTVHHAFLVIATFCITHVDIFQLRVISKRDVQSHCLF